MIFKSIRCALGAAALLTASAAAPAYAMTLSAQNGSDIFDGGGNLGVTVEGGPRDVDARAGGFRVTDGVDDFLAWCLDIATNLSLPSDYLETDTPFADSIGTLSATILSNIESLFETAYSTLDVMDNQQSAGFQLALWEILYETSGDLDLTTGSFQQTRDGTAQDGAEAFANGFLDGLGGPITQGYDLTFWESVDTGSGRSQNLVSVTAVPLPAAGLLLLAGLGAIAGASRSRRS